MAGLWTTVVVARQLRRAAIVVAWRRRRSAVIVACRAAVVVTWRRSTSIINVPIVPSPLPHRALDNVVTTAITFVADVAGRRKLALLRRGRSTTAARRPRCSGGRIARLAVVGRRFALAHSEVTEQGFVAAVVSHLPSRRRNVGGNFPKLSRVNLPATPPRAIYDRPLP